MGGVFEYRQTRQHRATRFSGFVDFAFMTAVLPLILFSSSRFNAVQFVIRFVERTPAATLRLSLRPLAAPVKHTHTFHSMLLGVLVLVLAPAFTYVITSTSFFRSVFRFGSILGQMKKADARS